MMKAYWALGAALLSSQTGCLSGSSADEHESTSSPLLVETVPPAEQIRHVWRINESNPSLAYAANAFGMSGNCSGVLIGPNFFMVAAHCGHIDSTTAGVRFMVANGFGAADGSNRLIVNAREWTCRPIYQSFADGQGSDLALLYCPPNSSGLGPGDIFGYLDLDGRSYYVLGRSVVGLFSSQNGPDGDTTGISTPGQIAQSPSAPAFTTPIIPGGTPQYGLGTILTEYCLFTQVGQTVGSYGAVAMSATGGWDGEFGNSGSSYLDPATRRIIVGPLTTSLSLNSSESCPTGTGSSITSSSGSLRFARSIYSYIVASKVRSGLTPDHIVGSNITSVTNRAGSNMGLQTSTYASTSGVYLDWEMDSVLDFQHDVEAGLGESPRNHYQLHFDSPRRNLLWTLNSSVVSFDPYNEVVLRINKSSTSYQRIISHEKLNLTSGAVYRIGIMVLTDAQGAANPLSIGFCNLSGGSCQYSANRYLPTSANVGYQIFTVRGTVSSTAASLVIDTHTSFTGAVAVVSVEREGMTYNFDTADDRAPWRNDVTGDRAVTIPNGIPASANVPISYPVQTDITQSTTVTVAPPSWALFVREHSSDRTGWPARNSLMALVSGRTYRLCFSHRTDSSGSWNGVVRVATYNGSTWSNSLASTNFTPGSSWSSTCASDFVASADQSVLQFGVSNSGTVGVGYFIDDITISDVTP